MIWFVGQYEEIIGYMDIFLKVNVGYVPAWLAATLLVIHGISVWRVINKYTGTAGIMMLLICWLQFQ
jgi:hypothetical protein